MRRALIGVAILLAASGPARAFVVPSVLGMQLGEPLNAPGCNDDLPKSLCVETDHQPSADTWWFQVPIGGTTPGFLRSPEAGCVEVKDGKIDEIVLWTYGVDSQGQALALLTEKFGKPAYVTRRGLQNRMGAKFVGITAFWAKAGYEVTLDGVDSDLDNGTVTIETTDHFKHKIKSVVAPKL